MKISVIVPVYNTGKYLQKCIESLCRQTHRDLQIILVNDGSTDDSLDIMKQLALADDRINVIDKVHEGVSAARNAGLECAQGDYISFIDSDDWIDERTYEVCMDQAVSYGADAVYYEWTEEYSDGTSDVKGYDGRIRSVLHGDDVLNYYYKGKGNIRVSSGVLSRKILRGVWFDTTRERGEDMLFGFQALCQAQCIVYLNQPFYHRYHRLGSLSNRKGFFAADFGRATCTDSMLQYIQENKPQFEQLAYVKCFNYYMIILNRIVYFRAEKEYPDIYLKLRTRLRELLREMDTPIRTLPAQFYLMYRLYQFCKPLYFVIVRIYYKYVKQELDSKRQR